MTMNKNIGRFLAMVPGLWAAVGLLLLLSSQGRAASPLRLGSGQRLSVAGAAPGVGQVHDDVRASGLGYAAFTDDFNDNSLNPALWQMAIEGSGPMAAETNHRLEITLPATAHETGAGVFFAGVNSVCKVQGDFDMMVDYELLNWPSPNGVRIGLAVFNKAERATVERISLASNESPSGEHYAANFRSNPIIPATHFSGTLRMTRNADTLTAYYRATDGSWAQILSESGHTTGDMYFGLSVWSHDVFFADQMVKVAFDNFTLSQGRLLCVQMSSGKSGTASPAGAPFTYTHILTNSSDITDTFVIAHTSTQHWPTSHQRAITLGAGQSVTFTVTITPPIGVISGTVETTLITATSQTDADIQAVLTDRTTLWSWYQYIPMIVKSP